MPSFSLPPHANRFSCTAPIEGGERGRQRDAMDILTSDESPMYLRIAVSKSDERFRGDGSRSTIPYLELEFAVAQLDAIVSKYLGRQRAVLTSTSVQKGESAVCSW